MKRLIVYDTEGSIIVQSITEEGKGVNTPKGVPFMIVEEVTLKHKNVVRIDITDPNNHKLITEVVPPTEIDLLKERIASLENLQLESEGVI